MANKNKAKKVVPKYHQGQNRIVGDDMKLDFESLNPDEEQIVLFLNGKGVGVREAYDNAGLREGLKWKDGKSKKTGEHQEGQASSRVRNALRRLVAYNWVEPTDETTAERLRKAVMRAVRKGEDARTAGVRGPGEYRLSDAARKRLARLSQKTTAVAKAA